MTGLATAANGEDGGGSGGGGGDGAVAVSLIDALQRWADALEAQIDIMKSEVEGVRAENKELTRQARTDARLMEGDLWGPISHTMGPDSQAQTTYFPKLHIVLPEKFFEGVFK